METRVRPTLVSNICCSCRGPISKVKVKADNDLKHILQFANREKLPERDEKEGSREDSKLCNRSQKIVLGFSYKFYDKYLTDYVVMSGISPPELTRL